MSINIQKTLDKDADCRLDDKYSAVEKDQLHLSGPDFVNRVMTPQ